MKWEEDGDKQRLPRTRGPRQAGLNPPVKSHRESETVVDTPWTLMYYLQYPWIQIFREHSLERNEKEKSTTSRNQSPSHLLITLA